MKLNVFFLLIDSFRSDKFFNENKIPLTPNIDQLIKNGTYFQQAISTSDATILNWATIFSGLFPPKTGVRSEQFNKLNENTLTIFDILKKYDYNFYSYITTISKTLGIFPKFYNDDSSSYSEPLLNENVGEKILNSINTGKLKEPWFFFVHSMDLHFPIKVPKEFDSPQNGINSYEKQISAIDSWIGEFSKIVDTEKTLVIVTADHGAYINSIDFNGEIISTEENLSNEMLKRKIGFKIPKFLDPIKQRAFFRNEQKSYENKLKKISKYDLKPHQKRNLLSKKFEIDQTLFDEKVRIPLLFYGKNIKSNTIISQQVRNVDIFPTILDLLNIDKIPENLDGISLKPLLNGDSIDEMPAYLESTPLVQIKSNNVIGIRTSKYKYFRDSTDSKKRIHLYDLHNDPTEDENIYEKFPNIVFDMENILSKYTESNSTDEFNPEETQMIEDELRKMGYI